MRPLRFAALFSCLAAPLAAQGNAFYANTAATTGIQFRTYHFGAGAAYSDISQIAVPLAVAIPVSDKFAVDIGTYYASTSATPAGNPRQTMSGLTDAQIRGAYVFNQSLVATLVLNLPTGTKFDSAQVQAVGASASNWLLFPVNSFANGFSATGGVAGTLHAGEWNFGLAVSGRVNAAYNPTTADTALNPYKAGIEGRVRLGADRLIGQSRLTLGLTVSTFGNDVFGAGAGAQQSRYAPGTRFIGEASFTTPGLGGMITGYAWDYFRAAGDTGAASININNRENILTGGVSHRIPVTRTASLESVVEARALSDQGGGSGILVGVGTGLRMQLGDHFSFIPAIRGDVGSASFPTGGSASVTGFSGSALLRYSF